MKKITTFLSAIIIGGFASYVYADDDVVMFIEPDVAKSVIENYFGNFTKNMPAGFTTEYSDMEIMEIAIQEYNNMLLENDGFVSAEGIVRACQNTIDTISGPIKISGYTVTNTNAAPSAVTQTKIIRNDMCDKFITQLVNTDSDKSKDSNNCIYNVTMAPDKFHVKYTNKTDGHGFIRHCDSYIGWRNFNPGNIAGSPYQCAKIGGKAVFENEEIGFKALAYLLTETSAYKDFTLRQKVPKYTTSDPVKYTTFLENHGINVDKKLSSFKDNPKELDKLIHVIAQKEGWFNGKKACKEDEPHVKGSDKGIEYF